ncbi:LysR family transcriptional regulator [Sutterella sp.]|uniref:LysR family transcriptional regulator n=1 Tax=Sutterella sp. TaxID=1981025 RepID=UPI0026E06BE7|nr:LysR family transcriptional regulator [Sutterella sp.]MDO5531393.1 LysR family transcriptional regulator [Sutterella sp.]
MLDTRNLEAFVTLAKFMHFRRAAAALGISQPALTARIRALEEEVGGPLINRSNRTLSLTAAGEVFLADAERILSLMERAVRNSADIFDGPAGTLRIGACSATIATGLLAKILHEARRRFPELEITAEEDSPPALAKRLADGKIDCMFGITFGISFPEGTVSVPLTSFRAALVARKGTVKTLANGRPDPKSLKEQTFIFFETVNESPVSIENALSFVPRRTMKLPTVGLIASFVDAGLGIAILPEVAAPKLGPDTELFALEHSLLEIRAMRLSSSNSPVLLQLFRMLGELSDFERLL